MKKLILVTLILFLSLAGKSFAQTSDFDLQDTDGNSVKLSSLLAKGPVMLQFWATWCVPCKDEMKALNELWSKYKDSGFVYVAVSIDDNKSTAKVKPYIESKGYKFTVVFDTDLNVFNSFGGENPPFSVLINKKGSVIKTYTGYLQGDDAKVEQDIKGALSDAKTGKN
jgi:cytochrome c biogenesis protein CcmG/thiol:disulfide interchange protein DsbE